MRELNSAESFKKAVQNFSCSESGLCGYVKRSSGLEHDSLNHECTLPFIGAFCNGAVRQSTRIRHFRPGHGQYG